MRPGQRPHPVRPGWPSPYLTVGYKCRCSSPRPRSGGPHPAALRGAWGWRRAPGGGGWSCGLGPHPHCSRGWRGRWTGSPPTVPPAGPGHSALPPPGSAPRLTPPLAVPGLWETENEPQSGQEAQEGTGGDRREGRGPQKVWKVCPMFLLLPSPAFKRTEDSKDGTSGLCPLAAPARAGTSLAGLPGPRRPPC